MVGAPGKTHAICSIAPRQGNTAKDSLAVQVAAQDLRPRGLKILAAPARHVFEGVE